MFLTFSKVCQLVEEGVDAIFGPGTTETSGIVSSMALKFEIPHVIYHWKSKPLNFQMMTENTMTLNLYPNSDILAEAFADVLVDYDWKSYTIVYETKESLIRLKDVLQIHNPKSYLITVRQLDNNYGTLLKEIKTRGDTHIILDISAEKIVPFLQEAAKVKMLTDYNSYFITNLDTHTLDLSKLPESLTNITCLRLVDPNSDELINALRVWRQRQFDFNMDEKQVPHEAGLVHNSLQIYFKALENYGSGKRNFPKIKNNCTAPRQSKSTYGFEMAEFMRRQDYDGVTGKVEFNTVEPYKGSRTQFRLETLELSRGEFSKIGIWDTTNKVSNKRELKDPEQQIFETIQNKTFQIVVKIGEPFLMLREVKEGDMALEGNARFKGYVVDLINRIQSVLKFRYELEVVPDGNYGNLNPKTNKWNGLVQHLLEHKADLAVADISITYERKTAVDFTMPFMSLGIGILYTKPPKKPTDLFSFLQPFTVDVWLYTGLAYISISVLVFILSRINCDDWESSHPCNQEPDEVESIWNILNCVWLSMGSIMGQGCDILPK